MIETKVPKDIRRFKGKALGPFTFRQAICIAIAVVVDIVLYNFIIKDMGFSTDANFMILTTCALPILAFSLEPNGMKMEDYIRTVLYKNITYPTKRKTITNLNDTKQNKKSEDIKQINKEYESLIKENPEWQMYK